MTGREILMAKDSLPKWENGMPPVLTLSQKQLDDELSCREMINSILAYWGENGLNEESFCYGQYLQKYVADLGVDTVRRLCDEQLDDFSQAVVNKEVHIDGEGVSYNTIVWADDVSLEEKLANAEARSVQQSETPDTCKVDILQIKINDDTYRIRYCGLSHFEHGVDDIDYKNYENVYSYSEDKTVAFNKNAEVNEFLEMIFTKFNYCRPEDFKGHSLSVSDVVVLSQGNECKAFYCDSFGFDEMPEKFMDELKKDFGISKVSEVSNKESVKSDVEFDI